MINLKPSKTALRNDLNRFVFLKYKTRIALINQKSKKIKYNINEIL
jgi:hypothetical protein